MMNAFIRNNCKNNYNDNYYINNNYEQNNNCIYKINHNEHLNKKEKYYCICSVF